MIEPDDAGGTWGFICLGRERLFAEHVKIHRKKVLVLVCWTVLAHKKPAIKRDLCEYGKRNHRHSSACLGSSHSPLEAVFVSNSRAVGKGCLRSTAFKKDSWSRTHKVDDLRCQREHCVEELGRN